jgi:hypothetical protein
VYQLTAKGERELAVWVDVLERQQKLMSNHMQRFRGAVSESQPPGDASDPDPA